MLPLSKKTVGLWTGDLSLFRGLTSTVPFEQRSDLNWVDFVERVAPASGPIVSTAKASVPYALPTNLQVASLVGRTLERARKSNLPEIGVQRSSSHVAMAADVVLEFDGIVDPKMQAIWQQCESVRHLIFSTYSHGNPEKPGNRFRVVLPLDRSVIRSEYAHCHAAINQLLGGHADCTGQRLEQVQGVWATHPKWKDFAFRKSAHGHLLAVEGLLALPMVSKGIARCAKGPTVAADPLNADLIRLSLPDSARFDVAMPWLVATHYSDWTAGLAAFKALEPFYSPGLMHSLAMRFAETSPPESTRAQRRDASQYDPEQCFSTLAPLMPPMAAAGVLLGMAKQNADESMRRDIGAGNLTVRGRMAVKYLASYHRGHFETVMEAT